jgi:predicted secreted protein
VARITKFTKTPKMKITKLALTLVLLTFGLNLQAQEGATEVKPQPIYKAPNGKAYPANWGSPPLRQTRDLRVLPGGYGRGSGTLARWIQQNLDNDAKNKAGVKPGIGKPRPAPVPRPIRPGVAKKAYPKHWGAPPRLQTKDLRPLPGGYGLGSSTLAKWIQQNLDKDAKNRIPKPVPAPPVTIDPVAPAFDPVAEANKNAKADLAKVQAGIKAWEVAKAKCKGNYSYKVGFESFVGFGHETTIVVSNNKVTERRYRAFNRRRPVAPPRPGVQAPQKAEGTSWMEQGKAIGTNKQGAPAKTLDELYVIALETTKKRLRQFERRYIRSDKQGLLVSCYIMDRRIADDAPRNGLVVSSITLSKVGTASTRETDVTRLTAKDSGKTITVKAGEEIEISLAGNPTTGFTWNNKTVAGTLKLSGRISHRAGGPALGAPGMSTAKYQALKPGKAEIILEYKRVFEDKPAAKTVKINVVVTSGIQTTQPGNAKVYRSLNGKAFPTHWGAPPLRQTRDLRPLPGGYGAGSGTLARWIQENLNKDAANPGRGKGVAKPKPAPGNKQARIATLEKEIARMKDFARRANFTREGFQKHKAKLAALEKELAELKGGKAGGGKQTGVPSFDEWVKGGMKIPSDRVFIGGSPWFDESKGERRTPRAVYQMLLGRKKPAIKPRPRPGNSRFPTHWGAPPRLQTKDLRVLPDGYGRGSSTLASWIQKNLDKDKANPRRDKDPKKQPKGGGLKSKLTLKDAQGGFAGFTGWITTVNEDGAWNRRQFFNQQLRPIKRRGKMTAAQLKSLTAALATAQVEKLPARIGKFLGANPHVVTLTYGDRVSVLTLPTGARLPEPLPGGKLDATGRFALVAHELKGLLKSQTGAKPGANKPVHKAPNGKAFPVHWGAPPRIQTRDLRPLPGGYGRGSSTLGRWIQQNFDKDAAGRKSGGNKANEIAKIKAEITNLENLKKVARFAPEGLAKVNAQIKELREKLAKLEKEAAEGPATPTGQRPAVSPGFTAKHPNGSYATGELLVGVEKGLSKEDSEKMLAEAIPGLKVKKAMINNTILHVILPESTNVELAMAKLKTVKAVRYSEINGRVGIQPAQPGGPGIGIGRPRPQIQPRTPPRKLGRPQVQPRR